MLDKCLIIAQMAMRDNLVRVNAESELVHPKNSFYLRYIKRIIDLTVSIPVFIVLLPINLILGIMTLIDVGRPVFFRQKRIGKDGKAFEIVKFRNMTNDMDESGKLLPPSERVTKFGKFMRKYSLDELLNFWSIIKGDMSLIGPRPLPVEFDERFSDRHRKRNLVKPGLECPCINSDSHVRLYQEQFENDIWYVENVSFLVDCKMVVSLFRMVFNVKERGDHAVVGGGDFVGYDEKNKAFSMRKIPRKYEEEYEKYLINNQIRNKKPT